MALKKGEVVQILGRAVERVGLKLDDPETPDEVTKDELTEIIQQTIADLLSEYTD